MQHTQARVLKRDVQGAGASDQPHVHRVKRRKMLLLAHDYNKQVIEVGKEK